MNKMESERSSKDNEERGGIVEGRIENFGFSSFANKRDPKRSFDCKVKLSGVAVVVLFSFLDIIFWIFLRRPESHDMLSACYQAYTRVYEGGVELEDLSVET